jgi:hypothetical protein
MIICQKCKYSTHLSYVRQSNIQYIIESIQHYVIKYDSDLQQIVCFLKVLRFPPPVKITATIKGLYSINRMSLDSRSDLIIHSLPTKYTLALIWGSVSELDWVFLE